MHMFPRRVTGGKEKNTADVQQSEKAEATSARDGVKSGVLAHPCKPVRARSQPLGLAKAGADRDRSSLGWDQKGKGHEHWSLGMPPMKHRVPSCLLGRACVRACIRGGRCRSVGVWRCGFGCVCYVLVKPVCNKSGWGGGVGGWRIHDVSFLSHSQGFLGHLKKNHSRVGKNQRKHRLPTPRLSLQAVLCQTALFTRLSFVSHAPSFIPH